MCATREIIGPSRSAAGARDALPRDPRQHVRWSGPVYPPPMVDVLGRVRRRTSGTLLWTCCAGCAGCAGRAGTRMRSEALHRRLTIGRLAADRAGARALRLIAETLSIRPRSGSNPRLTCPTNRYLGREWWRGAFADHHLRSKRSAEYSAWGPTDSGEKDVEAFAGHYVEI
jgi:hypothetical protein